MSSLILIIVLLFLSVQFSMLMVKNHTIALIYTSLMTNKVDHIFIFSSTIWIALLVSYLFEIFFFTQFSIGLSLLLIDLNSLNILNALIFFKRKGNTWTINLMEVFWDNTKKISNLRGDFKKELVIGVKNARQFRSWKMLSS